MTRPLTPFASALAGALGAVFSNAAVYPLDTVKTRLQALPSQPNASKEVAHASKQVDADLLRRLIGKLKRWRMLALLVRIIRTEGLPGVFKGFSASMIGTFSQQFAYFFFHTFLRTSALTRLALPSLSTAQELSLGALAGAFAQIFTIPVSVIATRQQLSTDASASSSLFTVGKEIVQEGGVTALWTGLKPGLVLTVNPAITYGCFERAKSWVLSGDRLGGKLSVGEAFWIGVGSKTLATVVTYPYIFAKVRLQARSASSSSTVRSIAPAKQTQDSHISQTSTQGSGTYAEIASHEPAALSAAVDLEAGEKVPYNPEHHQQQTPSSATASGPPTRGRTKVDTGAIAILRQVYAEQGVKGWYTGLAAQITKAVLCQGILFVSKEKFEYYALIIVALLGRLRSRSGLVMASK